MEEQKSDKLTYEQLENCVTSLSEENKRLKETVHRANEIITSFQTQVNRIDIGFKILENAVHFPNETINNIVNEITEMMFPVEAINKEAVNE